MLVALSVIAGTLVCVFAFIALDRMVNGPVSKKPLQQWEWYRFDHEPDPEHDNEAGHWIDFHP